MKRLIVCCDGTWQKLDSPYPTNVVKIAQAVKSVADDGVNQIVFYDEGIGTESKWNMVLGGAFGEGIDRNIQDAYRFLSLNYVPGDEIYLFGFSRGAYTVRSLAGMIYNSGLLTRSNIRHLSDAYEWYRSRDVKPNDSQMLKFRQKYCIKTNSDDYHVPIKLLCCWDTVGSLGIPDVVTFLQLDQKFNHRYKFHDTSLSPIIQYALHAVAIDEQRKTFSVTPMNKSRHSDSQIVYEVWFPGDHGCVGGGMEQLRGLSDTALQWKIDCIGKLSLGLALDPTAIPTGIQPDFTINFINDLIGQLTRLGGITLREVSEKFEDIHESVILRWQKRTDYRPRNLLEKHRMRIEAYQQILLEKQ